MSDDNDAAGLRGGTRTDLRLTRVPMDAPRARLHLAARTASQVGRTAAEQVAELRQDEDLAELQGLARRAGWAVHRSGERTDGARVISRLSFGLDRALSALVPLAELGVARLGDELTTALVLLEAAEHRIDDLKREHTDRGVQLTFERDRRRQLEAELAAIRAAGSGPVSASAHDADPPDSFEEPTVSRVVTELVERTLEEPAEHTMIGVAPPVHPHVRRSTTRIR